MKKQNLHEYFMSCAIAEAKKGVDNKDGGPFGAVIVKDNKIIAKGHNQVIKKNDPTCHGEMQAIRSCCKKLHTYNLSGYVIYTTGEPCLMCLCACMWANIKKIYFGCTISENAKIGFRDNAFFNKLSSKKPKGYLKQIMHDECWELFEYYNKTNSQKY